MKKKKTFGLFMLMFCSGILLLNGNGKNESSIEDAGERTVSIVLSEHSNQPILDMAPAQQEILKRKNIRIKFEAVPGSNYEDKKNILLATNNLPDIISVKMSDLNSFASTGIFLPLTGYFDQMPNFKAHWDRLPDMKKFTIDGELYGFPLVARNEAKNGYGPVIRMDLLEKHNLPVPQTWDELSEVLSELKTIYPDSVPWTLRKGSKRLFQGTAYMLGSGFGGNGYYFDDQKGKYVFAPATKEFKEALRYYNKIYEAGILDPEYVVTTTQTLAEKMSSGKSFFFCDNSGFGLNWTNDLRKSNPEAKLQILPIPENSYGERRAEFYQTILPGTIYAVNAQTENPEQIIDLMDFLYSEEGSNITNFGVEGVSFTLDEQGQPQYIPEFVMKFIEGKPAPYYALYSNMGISKLNFSPWGANTMTQFQIEKITGNWTDLYDEYWGIVGNDDAYRDPYLDPPLTPEESDRLKDIQVSLSTMLEQEYDKFIIGVKPIDEWDDVIVKAEELGARELEDILNGALDRLQ